MPPRQLLRSFSSTRARSGAKRALERASAWPVIGGLADDALFRRAERKDSSFPLSEVHRVLDALEESGVPAWLAGGWGADALFGAQSRSHADLDIVLDDFEAAIEPLDAALSSDGYHRLGTRDTGMWWRPQGVDFCGPRGERIEVLGINWDLLATASLLVGDPNAVPVPSPALRSRCFTTGMFGQRPVPCLSALAQLLVHKGYASGPTDYWPDVLLRRIAGLAPIAGPKAATALLVMSGALDAPTRSVWRRLNDDQPCPLPPHLSICSPFLPWGEIDAGVLSRVDSLIGSFTAFDYELCATKWLGDRVLSLAPKDPHPFAELTRAITTNFPGAKPYGGAFDDVIPHLTLGEDRPLAELRRAEQRSTGRLPLKGRVEEVWLVVEDTNMAAASVAARFGLRNEPKA